VKQEQYTIGQRTLLKQMTTVMRLVIHNNVFMNANKVTRHSLCLIWSNSCAGAIVQITFVPARWSASHELCLVGASHQVRAKTRSRQAPSNLQARRRYVNYGPLTLRVKTNVPSVQISRTMSMFAVFSPTSSIKSFKIQTFITTNLSPRSITCRYGIIG
jgi:hypothetical protein